MIPVSSGKGATCLKHECAKCCYETEMPLLESDIERLEKLGHARDAFTEMDPAGYPVLRNVAATLPREGHHCFFLKEDKCSVYEHRPEGCRWYPIVVTPERRVVKDEDCPHRSEFSVPPDSQRRLVKLINTLEREARTRQRAR